MKEDIKNDALCIHLKGKLILLSIDGLYKFSGTLNRGLRLLFWGNSIYKGATSSSLIYTLTMDIGEAKIADVVILSPQSIDKELIIGETYSLGTPSKTIAKFQLSEVVGLWDGKVP
jgi:hypothetical protein